MDLWTIISAVSGAFVAVGIPLVSYIVKQRDAEAAELKRDVGAFRDRLQTALLDAKDRDTKIAVLESKIEGLEHTVTRTEFDGAMKDLRNDIREIKDYVMPAPIPRGGSRYGARYPSTDSMPAAPKDPKR